MKIATNGEIREWMDRQIESFHVALERITVNEDGDYISNIGVQDKGIHLGAEPVRFIANTLGLDLCVTARKMDSENPYEIFFLYKNTKFFGIETEAEYKERGAVV